MICGYKYNLKMDDEVLDWNKLKTNSEKVGHKDGIANGRLSNFQKSFDEGYKSGFKNGFQLGKLKGSLRECNLEELKQTKKGNCCICLDESLIEKFPETITDIQWKSSKNIIDKLTTINNE